VEQAGEEHLFDPRCIEPKFTREIDPDIGDTLSMSRAATFCEVEGTTERREDRPATEPGYP
jgi:hypothetical protein